MDGKPSTMRVCTAKEGIVILLFYRERTVSAPIPEGCDYDADVWQRMETSRWWLTLIAMLKAGTITEYIHATMNGSEKGEVNVNTNLVCIQRRIH
jgi:hypothetical protein